MIKSQNLIDAYYIVCGFSIAILPRASLAGWNPQSAGAVEDLLKEFTRSLERGNEVTLPRVFLYQGKAISRSCPKATGIDAPSYCPGDNTIYLETSLGDAIDARYGDFGALSILAHEYGHAYMSQLKNHPLGKDGELLADRYAGAFARFAENKGTLEAGDLNEARQTFKAVGDYSIYSHDHHGTPSERLAAFDMGYASGFRMPTGSGADEPITDPQTHIPVPTSPSPQAQPGNQSSSPTELPAAAVSLVGLGFGLFVAIIIGAVAIVMIRKAAEEE